MITRYTPKSHKMLGIFGILVILVTVCALLYYLFDREYLEGAFYHYKGISSISKERLGELAIYHDIGYDEDIESRKLAEDDTMVEITYDFYGPDDLAYLIKLPFSFFDAPIITTVIRNDSFILLLLYFLAAIIIVSFVNWIPKPAKQSILMALNNAAWYWKHPKYIFKKQFSLRIPYSFCMPLDIKINPLNKGILGTRTWKYKDGRLYSTGVGQSCWENRVLLSDKCPLEDNGNGVYAKRLGCFYEPFIFDYNILGIVSLTGIWMEHADGIVRAESCEILHLIVSHKLKDKAESLSSFYGVPVTISDNTVNTYTKWLFSPDGFECLEHNFNI